MATQQIEVKVVDKTKGALRGIDNRIKKVEGSLLSVNKVAGLAVAALGGIGAANLARGIIATTARFEDLRTTLSSVTGSLQEGTKAFQFVSEFATQTQFGIEELSVAFTKLKSNGIDPTKELLTTFTDAAAVTTDQLGSLTAITDFYTRSLQSQTVELMDLDRLADRGLPVYDILKEKLGVSRAELGKFSKEAGNTTKIIDALGNGIKERFGGATEARLKNLSTALSNMEIGFKNVQNAIGQGGVGPAMTELVNVFNKMLERALPLATIIGDKLGFAIFKLSKFIQESNFDMGMFIKGAKIAAAALGGAGLIAVLKGVTNGVKALTLAMARNPIGLLAVAAASVITFLSMENGLGKTLTQIFAVMNKVGEVFSAVGTFLKDVFAKVIEKLTGVFDSFVNGVIRGINSVSEFVGLGKIIESTSEDIRVSVGNTAVKAFNAVSGAITETIDSGLKYVNSLDVIKRAQAEGENVLEMLTKAYVDAGVSYDEAEKAARAEYNERIKGIPAYDDQIIRLARVAGGNKDVASSFEQASASTKEFKTKLQNLIKSYDEYRFTTVEIFKKQQEDNFKIFSEALENMDITQQQYNELRLAANKKLNELIQEQNAETTAKYEENMLKQINATLSANDAILSADQKNFLQKKGAEERQQKITGDRIEFEKKSELEKTQFAIGQATDMFNSLGQMNKQAFQAAKAFNIANAIMNTYMGATKALATYPPPFNFIAAAAVVASGLAQVSAIRSQQYTGRQRGGNLTLGQGTIVGEDGPELIVPKQPSTVIPREVAQAVEGLGGRGDNVNVNFTINTVDARGMDELLLERRGTITGIINQAMQSKGRRGIV